MSAGSKRQVFRGPVVPPADTPPVSSEPSDQYNPSKWESYHNLLFDNLGTKPSLTDYAFQVEMLTDDEALGLDRQSLVNLPPFVKYDFEYNFFVPGYENSIAGDIPETLLPSLYVIASEVQRENLDSSFTPYAQQITVDNRVKTVLIDIISETTGEKTGELDYGEYFDKYVYAISNPPITSPLESSLQQISDRYKNTIFPQSGIDIMRKYNNRKSLFPMYAEISFQTDQFTEVAEILTESGMAGSLIKHVIDTPHVNVPVAKTDVVLEDPQGPRNGPELETDKVSLDGWDVTAWVKNLTNTTSSSGMNETARFGNKDMIFMGGESLDSSLASSPQQNLYRRLMSTLLYSKMMQLAKNSLRSMSEIFNGSISPSETVFYEITKYSGADAVEENIIQKFYFVNSNDIDVLDFVDTQVKYNKQYTYVVSAYQMVLGNRYNYLKNTAARKVTQDLAEIEIENRASYFLFKVPLNSKTNRILQRPPVPNDVDIVPYRGINNKLLLNLSAGTGNYQLDPVAINAQDEQRISEMRESQNRPTGPLEYETSQSPTVFQIFRIERLPASYNDFDNNMIAEISTVFRKDRNYFLSSAAFRDTIEPNKDYYYATRVLDSQGQPSNPTAIYKVRSVDDGGAVYPLIETIQLSPPGFFTKRRTKSMRKYIQLIPSLPQTLLNEEQLFKGGPRTSPLVNDSFNSFNSLPIGVMNEGVWDQRYKVRLVSKKTGRKIDINLEFKHRGDTEGGDPTT
jgi:hypothetical protein